MEKTNKVKKANKKMEIETVKVPSGVTVQVANSEVVVTGSGKTFQIPFKDKMISIKLESDQLGFSTVGKPTKPKVSSMRAIMSHVKNAFVGISTGFSKKFQVVYSHFPVSIETKGKEVVIKNFLGEKLPRSAQIIGDTKVEVKGQDITVTGSDKYSVGQTGNNLMVATMIRKKDRRVFQDGIYPVIE